jgi:type IV secretory pathway VirB6-like protein
MSFYGKKEPDSTDHQNVANLLEKFKSLITRERLDAKSFFQDQDRHNHFKVSPKQFKQTTILLGVDISDAETASVVNVYANKLGDIEYLRFLNDCDVLSYIINEPFTGAKSTYRNYNIDFSGSESI